MNIASHRAEQLRHAGLEIRQHSGRSVFCSGSKPIPGLIAVVLPTSGEQEIAAAVNAGVQLFVLRGFDIPFIDNREELGSALNAAMKPLLSVAPDAQVILEWNCEPSAEWLAANSQEAAVFAAPGEPLVSWASPRWLRAAETVVRNLLTARTMHPLAAIIITTRAGGWGVYQDPRLRDTGRAMTERLRSLVRDRYRRNVNLLRQAWNEPTLDFHTLRCPRLFERKSDSSVVFARAGLTDITAADYWDAIHSTINDALIALADAVKNANSSMLVGANCAALHAGVSTPGGIAEQLADCSAIDFFLGPTEGCSAVVRLITGSLGLRNKMVVQQETALTPAASVLVNVHQSSLVVPIGPSQHDWSGALKNMKLSAVREAARTSAAAVLLDSSAMRTTTQSEAAKQVHDVSCNDLIREAAMSGLSFDVYLFSDVYRKDFPMHPMTLAANLYYLSDADKQKLDGKLKNREQTIVWFWGVGLQGESGASSDNIAKLTGIKLKREEVETGLQIRVVACKDSALNGLKEGDRLGSQLSVSPTFTITDRAAIRAATNSSGKTALAIMRHQAWTSILVMTPVVTGALLRSIAGSAGLTSFWNGSHHQPVLRAAGSRLAVFSDQSAGTLNLVGRDTWVTSEGADLEGTVQVKPGTVFSAVLKTNRTDKPTAN